MSGKRLLGLSALLVMCCIAYMTVGAKGNWSFVVPFRGQKLVALITVAVAVSSSTLMFQTIAHNRILTPSVMGFDALYVFIITISIFLFGSNSLVQLGPGWVFLINTAILLVASNLLFGSLLFDDTGNLSRMVLTGIILGTMFRSASGFAVRLIDPNEYASIQISSYARFNRFDMDLLIPGVLTIIASTMAAWRLRHRLDVICLGNDLATGLGAHVRRTQLQALFVIAVLVSVSTALVGPVMFLGLLVVSIARFVTPVPYHGTLLVSAGLVSSIILVGGQTILERSLGLAAPLSVIVDIFGGLLFLAMLLNRSKK